MANLQPVKVYVVDVTGTAQDAFRKELVELLAENGHFIVSSYGTQPASPDTASSLPVIIVSGNHETRQETRTYSTGSGKDEKNYKETNDLNLFDYTIRDAATDQVLDGGRVTHSDIVTEEDQNSSFLGSVVNSLVKSAGEALLGIESSRRKSTIRSFIDRLVLHRENRFVELIRDGDLPGLNDGVSVEVKGDWNDAVKKLQEVAENNPGHPSLHKAYYDLGIAYESMHNFERALVSLRLAYEQGRLQQYKDEIEWCESRARLSEWQERYLKITPP